VSDSSTPDTSTTPLDHDLSAAATYITSSAVQQWAASPVTPDSISVQGRNGTTLVTIHPDGRLEYGPDYTPDTAARAFWDALQQIARAHRFGAPLNASINAHLRAGEEAERKVARLDQMALAWLERLPDTILTKTAADAIHHITRGDAR
jgi:hypothetical protein